MRARTHTRTQSRLFEKEKRKSIFSTRYNYTKSHNFYRIYYINVFEQLLSVLTPEITGF